LCVSSYVGPLAGRSQDLVSTASFDPMSYFPANLPGLPILMSDTKADAYPACHHVAVLSPLTLVLAAEEGEACAVTL
jgi:hypothetical protein